MTNREIDKEMAEKVMEWLQVKALPDRCVNHPRWFIVNLDEIIYIDDFHVRNVFKPTELIQDAFMVVEKMIEKGYKYFLSYHKHSQDKWHYCAFETPKGDSDSEATDKSPSMAICLAALKAIK